MQTHLLSLTSVLKSPALCFFPKGKLETEKKANPRNCEYHSTKGKIDIIAVGEKVKPLTSLAFFFFLFFFGKCCYVSITAAEMLELS